MGESTMLKSILFLSLAVLLNTTINLLLRQSARGDTGTARMLFAGAVLLVAVSAFCYARSLARIDLSVAYPVFAAGSILLICLASRYLFGETISVHQAVGMAAIVGGMVLVCWGK